MKESAKIHLMKDMFLSRAHTLVERGELVANMFSYDSGVQAVRLSNRRGELVLLPFQGQQIWSATFDKRPLTMRSMFEQPFPTREFLATYGAFLVHCGATAMGAPGPEDKHPLHGELPNAPYQSAEIVLGEDEQGEYIGLTGEYHHQIFFSYNYLARPLVKLYVGQAVFSLSLEVTNLYGHPSPLMYLAHINFRPVDNGQLFYTAHHTPEHVRVRASFPSFMKVDPALRQFAEELKDKPELHDLFTPGLRYDPEIVFFIDQFAGEDGWARSMQLHPDGTADVVRHRPEQLSHVSHWISRTPDQDCLGFEPATAEPTGFISEQAKGNVRWLEPGEMFHCDMQIGFLTTGEASGERELIARTILNARG